MKVMLARVALAGVALALAALAGGVLTRGYGAAQEAVTIGLDADPTGNTATSLGPIESCLSVSTGDTFQIDVFVTDVTDLLAWETYFVYDMSIISVVSRDVAMFQAANEGSNVFDVSEGLPDIDGRYGVAAVDLADPPAPDSGSGVLARLTLKAIGAGVSPASLSPIDVNGDGTLDLGLWLKDIEAEPIGDADGDGFFDSQILNAQIAVDTACPGDTPGVSPTAPPASPTPTAAISPTAETTPTMTETVTATPPPASPTPRTPLASPTPENPVTTEDEGSPWTGVPAIIGYVLGGLAVLFLASVGFLGTRRRGVR
jgi:hypothetical protein